VKHGPFVAVLLVAGLLVGCAPPVSQAGSGAAPAENELASPTDNTVSEELIAYGLQVYKQQSCGTCHQLDVASTAGMFGPSQNNIGSAAEQRIEDSRYTGQATTAAEYIRESIVDPAAYYVEGYQQSRHRMPAFTHLSEAELNALVQILLQQK
jgi:nitric oxide reductase subunit C